MKAKTLREKCDAYFVQLTDNKRVTKATLKNYRSTVNRFHDWALSNGRPFSQASIQEFVASFEHTPTANTVRVRLKGLAKFHRLPTQTLEASHTESKLIRALNSEEVVTLLAGVQGNRKLYALVMLLSQTGLRWAEYCAISRDDRQYSKAGACTIKVMGKGRKERTVPISPAVQAVWEDIPFHPSLSQQDTLRVALRTAGERVGLPIQVHPHLFRKSYISIAINERGLEPLIVANIVGHSNLNTMLKHYYEASPDRLYEAV
jgi:integrase